MEVGDTLWYDRADKIWKTIDDLNENVQIDGDAESWEALGAKLLEIYAKDPAQFIMSKQSVGNAAEFIASNFKNKKNDEDVEVEFDILERAIGGNSKDRSKLLFGANASKGKKSNGGFQSHVLEKGAATDKINAMAVMLQEDPLVNYIALGKLIKLAGNHSKRIATQALTSLAEVFSTTLLPEGRRLNRIRSELMLKRLSKLFSLGKSNRSLFGSAVLFAYFEDYLKVKFAEFIAVLEKSSTDAVEALRNATITCSHKVLRARPEGEQILLSFLVNKLGDSSGKVSTHAVDKLNLLCKEHAGMIPILKSEIDSALLRPHNTQRFTKAAMVLLGQIKLGKSSSDVALSFVKTYLRVFEIQVAVLNNPKAYPKDKKRQKKNKNAKSTDKGEEKSLSNGIELKILSLVLYGLNYALPFCKEKDADLLKKLDVIFKIIHSDNWNVSIQALSLLLQIIISESASNQEVSNISDRFFRALYERLLALEKAHHSIAQIKLFFNVLYRSMRVDTNVNRVYSFIKRILQVSLHQPSEIACASLFLINKIDELKSKDSGSLLTCLVSMSPDPEMEANAAYDMNKRDPSYSNAETSCLWELNLLTKHSQPAVRIMAELLLKQEQIRFEGDPIDDFTTFRFLTKFVADGQIKDSANSELSKKRKLSEIELFEKLYIDTYMDLKNESESKKKKQKSQEEFADEDEFAEALFEGELQDADFFDEDDISESEVDEDDDDEEENEDYGDDDDEDEDEDGR
jgi:ribosome biogenesis protein MAK21